MGLVEAGPDYGPYAQGRWPRDMLDARQRLLAFLGDGPRGPLTAARPDHRWLLGAQCMRRARGRAGRLRTSGGMAGATRRSGRAWSWRRASSGCARSRARSCRLGTRPSPRRQAARRSGIRSTPSGPCAGTRRSRILTRLAIARTSRSSPTRSSTGAARPREGRRRCYCSWRYRAETVVLTAGAYGSPGILLRSGIGPDLGLPVGDGLCDHVGVGFGYEGTARLQQETADFERSHALFMAQLSVGLSSSRCPEGVYDLFIFPRSTLRDAPATRRARPSLR